MKTDGVFRRFGVEPHSMGLEASILQEVLDGKKTVEARLARGKFLDFMVGDTVRLRKDVYSGDQVVETKTDYTIEVTHVRRYGTVREMLIAEGVQNAIPSAESLEEAEAVYYQLYSKADEKAHGIIAIGLSVSTLSKNK